MVITISAVIVALLAATGVWFFAFRDSKPGGGQASPQDAANAILVSLSQKDPVGVADQLDPAEAGMFSDITGDVLAQLKRLNIVTADASPNNMSGATLKVEGLTFDPASESVNDHLTIVKLIGGTVTLTSDPTKIPLTEKIRSAFGAGLTTMKPQTKTIDIANEVAKNGKPIRIATVQRNGKWYPSLFYSAADNWAQSQKLGNPKAEDAIPNTGASSPEAAMDALLDAVSKGDAQAAIALLPPEEMGVLHDYGKLLLKAAHYKGAKATGVHFRNAAWNVADTTGGKVVSVKSLTVSFDGKEYSVLRDGDSLTVTVPGQAPLVLNDSTIDSVIAKTGGKLDPQAIAIVKQEFKQVLGLGVVMTQSGSQWYVSPLRSYVGIFTALLKGLQATDIDYFISLAKK